MEGRRLIRLSSIHEKARSIDMDGDWVAMGVIVSKTDPKVSLKARNLTASCKQCSMLMLQQLTYDKVGQR